MFIVTDCMLQLHIISINVISIGVTVLFAVTERALKAAIIVLDFYFVLHVKLNIYK